MRVLIVGAGHEPSSFIKRHIEGLRARDVEVELLPEPRRHKVAVARALKRGFVLPMGRRSLRSVKSADLIHFQWPGYLHRYGVLATKYGKPTVLSLRGRQINILPYLPGNESYVENLRNALSLADRFHCVSKAIMDEGIPFGVDPARSKVIRPAMDTTFFTPPEERGASEEISILMVGALMWRKAYEHALVAFARLPSEPSWRVRIVGQGEDEDHIRYTIADLGLGDRVSLIGARSAEEIRDLMRSADILVHASVSEGIANVSIEAMACGLPVVAADSGGMSEAIDDGVHGRLVSLRDAVALSSAVRELILDPAKRKRMGEAGRKRAVEEFELSDQAAKFVELYQEVLA